MAYGAYESALRELIHLLKYDAVRPAAAVLGRMLRETILSLETATLAGAPSLRGRGVKTLVVPVPLHPRKLRERGFNQAELIARAALKSRELEGCVLQTSALIRQRATESQTGLTRHQRRRNVRGAFRVARPNEILERDILLVDDVFTTGTTAFECARVLRAAGAASVWVATVARVLKPELAHTVPPQDDFDNEEEKLPIASAAHA